MSSLRVDATVYRDIVAHLLHGQAEEAAFAYATTDPKDSTSLTITRIVIVPPEGFAFQSPQHIEIDAEYLSATIKAAWDTSTALVEFHSHPGQTGRKRGRDLNAEFSESDLFGFEEWVPRVMWRLKNRQPYAAVVVAPDSLDMLLWLPGDAVNSPRPINAIFLTDGTALHPTNRTLATLRARRRTA